ncbi:TetR/AcrR family transcriptional regulator [Paenibacillus psychroresistens]|uniref:TetR/AcrR family transcriptional regulator n=1 Tax=Paenibacillus psychroresistens TaxID=1778678 RepID=A0A6B8RPF5_9BACL|nr:TetR/AcrR family transcriptional regulator [Paenibacillus psychroresistens]QGQ97198.1 TetR/AcrR family transcriptional regulator [Paenibacillus psychroresistens]
MEKKESAKDRILQVASELFYYEGIRAVGIDRIIAESEVAKASFYRNFATKDDLVVAFLEQRHGRSLARVADAKNSHPNDPSEQLRYLFGSMAARMKQPDFRGCPFLNTVVEFPNPDHPGHIKAISCRQALWVDVIQMARDAGAVDPDELAAQLEVLYNGAVMMAYVHKTFYNPDHFYKAVLLLIKDQVPDFEIIKS